jgi:hypothetical protein
MPKRSLLAIIDYFINCRITSKHVYSQEECNITDKELLDYYIQQLYYFYNQYLNF